MHIIGCACTLRGGGRGADGGKKRKEGSREGEGKKEGKERRRRKEGEGKKSLRLSQGFASAAGPPGGSVVWRLGGLQIWRLDGSQWLGASWGALICFGIFGAFWHTL